MKGYSKFSTFALLMFDGDFKKASKKADEYIKKWSFRLNK